jgi:cell division transport system permease protein
MKHWLAHHVHSLKLALRRLLGAPLATAFSILVIGVALSLPTSLYVALVNLQRLAGDVTHGGEITLYLKARTDESAGRRLAESLGKRAGIARAEFVSREQGLKWLEQGGMGDLLAGLTDNPLPHVISLMPTHADAETMARLAEEISKRPEVDHVALDGEWARRLDALLGFGETLAAILAGILGLALATITGNTIRLQIYALREEIEVSRLIGATDRFIRRPFLYFGAAQGLLGGGAGLAIVYAMKAALATHVDRLAAAYGSQFPITGPNPLEILVILATATFLGLLGAYLSVGHALRRLDR